MIVKFDFLRYRDTNHPGDADIRAVEILTEIPPGYFQTYGVNNLPVICVDSVVIAPYRTYILETEYPWNYQGDARTRMEAPGYYFLRDPHYRRWLREHKLNRLFHVGSA